MPSLLEYWGGQDSDALTAWGFRGLRVQGFDIR